MINDTLPLTPLAMIIEDDEKLSAIYSEAVRQAGFTTRAVHDGNEAIKELEIFQPRLVILDLHLPHVTGAMILRAIRADQRFRKTKVIITTADTITAQTLEQEGDLVLIKPVSFIQLRDLAYRIVKTRIV